MHTSTGRLLFARRYPRGRRANFGVFSIPKPTGAGTDPQNRVENPDSEPSTPQGSLIFYRMRLMAPDFRPKTSMQAPSTAENSQKCTPRPTPDERQPKNRARPSSWRAVFPQNRVGPSKPSSLWSPRPGALRRTQEALAARSAQRGLLACPRTRREGACSPPGQERLITRRCKPSCACPRQHRTGYQSGSREASSSRDRSRCSQPGRSRSRRRRKPCCRSRPPGR